MPVGSSKDLEAEAKPRTICAFDLDNFYVACERLRDPSLIGLPVGIQQKNILATCSYEARARGIGKLQNVKEAKKACPDLVIVNGEDLTNYRVQSRKVWRLVKRIVGPSCAVEKLGMDELFVDVTCLLTAHLEQLDPAASAPYFKCHEGGFTYASDTVVGHSAPATFEHAQRPHMIATHLAAHIREAIHRELGLTVSGGVADNKLLSKLLASIHKPAKQTCLAQTSAEDLQPFLDELPLQKLPGFGYRTRLTIAEHLPNLEGDDRPVEEQYTVLALRKRATQQKLCHWLDPKIGARLWGLLHGQDDQPIIMTPDYPTQITVEDSFGGLKNFDEVMRNARALALHLIERLELELLEEPALEAPASPQPQKRAFVRFPTQLRLAVRIDPATRESKTLALPAEMLDLNTSRDDRADFVTNKTLLPLFKSYFQDRDPTNLRIINVGVTGLSTSAPPRSVKELISKSTAPSKRKTAAPDRPAKYSKNDIDQSVLDELPEEMQAELRRELGLKPKASKALATCQYKCGAVILPGAMEAHLRWHRKQRK